MKKVFVLIMMFVLSTDFGVQKLASASELWVARYNGPGNDYDKASAIAIDSSGNVYVTGGSYGSGTSNDYATIKYNSSGDTLWVRRYNGPGNGWDAASAITLDDSGNVYVTGGSYGSGTHSDCATIKYNSLGDSVWVARYDGPDNGTDYATAIAIDSGYVYVTGYSESSGTKQDYVTIKYNSLGDSVWVARYDGPDNSTDWTTAIAVDDSSNVYVTGYSVGSGTSYDYATIKYNSSGDSLWVRRYNGPDNGNDYASGIAVDKDGNICVTGTSMDSVTGEDYATVKYNTLGEEQWIARYTNRSDNKEDIAYAIAIDSSGNVYVTGYSWGYNWTFEDYATVKYNPSGREQWVTRYGKPDDVEYAYAITVDNAGNIYVTGWGVVANAAYITIKYNTLGERQWVAKYNGPYRDDWAYAIAVDDSGNVYVTGCSYNSDTSFDYATVKYDSLGVEQWVARYNGPSDGGDWAKKIVVDGNGNVYVTGWSMGLGTSEDYATIKYNSSGDTLWVRRYNGLSNGSDKATDIAVDGAGNVYVTGNSGTIKYNNSGDKQWIEKYNSVANAIALDGTGNVYVTGWSYGSGTGYDYVTIKYSCAGIEESEKLKVKGVKLKVYPNPVVGSAIIKYQLPVKSEISLKIYDITGRIVKTLASEEKKAGSYNVSFDTKGLTTGIYFAKLVVDDYKETKKLILMK